MTPAKPTEEGGWRYEALKQLERKGDEQHERCGGRILTLGEDVRTLRREVHQDYVTKKELEQELELIEERYKPIVKIAYGLATAVGVALLAAILKLVIK